VKQLTGGEPMLARGLFQGFIEFSPIFKLAVFGNEKPRVDGVDHGIWRRLRVVPWLVTIADNEARDLADVVAEMLEEGPGILNWLLEGLKLYLAEGLRPPEAVVEATKEYRNENDPVGPFLSSHVTQVEPAENEAVTARDLYQAYLAWGEANGVKPISETRFGKLMPQKGLKRTDERVRRYLDIRLHDVPVRDPPRSGRSDTAPAAPREEGPDPF
jgi:putative DNA primase/helicase